MIAINVEDKAVRLLDISKGITGKITIDSLLKADVKKGEQWEEKILNVKGEVGLSIPDSACSFVRVLLPVDTSNESLPALVLDQVQEKISIPLHKMIFDTAIVDRTENGIEVIFIGIEFEKLLPFYKSWTRINLTPAILVPESLAFFEALKSAASENHANLLVSGDDDQFFLMFYDLNGPLSSKMLEVEFEKLAEKINDEVKSFEKENDRKVTKVVMAGDQGDDLDCDMLSSELTCTKSHSVIEELIQKHGINLKDNYTSKSSFLNTIGLGLILLDKNKFNLMKKNLPDIMESLIKEPEENVKQQKKEDQVEDKKVQEEEKHEIKEKITEEKQETEYFAPPEKKKKIYIMPFIIFFITLVVSFGGLYLYDSGSIKNLSSLTSVIAKPTIVPTATPSPTKAPVKREDLKVQVLNGTGKEGAASTMAELLEKKGYKDVNTDNADNYDYTGNVLKIKEKYKSFANTDLSDFTIEKTETLENSSTFDLIFVVGE